MRTGELEQEREAGQYNTACRWIDKSMSIQSSHNMRCMHRPWRFFVVFFSSDLSFVDGYFDCLYGAGRLI